MPRGTAVTSICIVLGIAFAAVAVFYATQVTSLLASDSAHHYKHAILAAVLCVVSFVAANFARQSPAA